MSRVNGGAVSVSLDGFMAGPDQSEAEPIGRGGRQLHTWIFATRGGRAMIGESGGTEGVDNEAFNDDFENLGATIMGRNMFGPIRDSWAGSDWRGWWGEEPPYGHPVFVLTHFERPDLAVGKTTFRFVTEGIATALELARAAAGDRDVHISGGASTIRQYLDAQLIDDLHVAVVPVNLGDGARLFDVVGEWPQGYELQREVEGEGATHCHLVRSAAL